MISRTIIPNQSSDWLPSTPTKTYIPHSPLRYQQPLTNTSEDPITLLEALLEKERRKNKSLENSLLSATSHIHQLKHELTKVQTELQQNKHIFVQLDKKNNEISFYQDSLEMIKREMEELNRTVLHKTNEYAALNQELGALKLISLQTEKQKNTVAAALGKAAEDINELLHQIARIEGRGQTTHRARTQQQHYPLGRELYDFILQLVRMIDEERHTLFTLNEGLRREHSERLKKETEKALRLEFELKLLEQRRNDEEKQLQAKRSDEKDRVIEELELKCLRIEEQSQRRLQEISQERQQMQSQLVEQSAQKQNSLGGQVKNLTRRLRDAEKEKKDLRGELERTRERYKLLNEKYTRLNLQDTHKKDSEEYLGFMKTLRRYEEEKKLMEIKLEELTFRNRTLESELQLYK